MAEVTFRDELAKRLGVHKNTIIKAAKKVGLKKRTKVTGGRRRTCYSIDEVLLIKHQVDKFKGTARARSGTRGVNTDNRKQNIFNSYQRVQEY